MRDRGQGHFGGCQHQDLEAVADLLDAQQLVVRVGQVLPLEEARQAHEMLEGLRPLPAGKVVLNALGDS
jgi:NADPH:quinone reductase-like Zn-dependent oxidoreductase